MRGNLDRIITVSARLIPTKLVLTMACLSAFGCGITGNNPPNQDDGASALVGRSCTRDSDCGAGTFCNAGYTFGATTCVPLIEHGDCESNEHCQSGRCAGVCIDRNRCQAPSPPSTAGWSCVDDSDCCDTGSHCTGGRCGTSASVGQSCQQDSDCGSGTFCNVGYTFGATTCVPLIDHGYCASNEHCQSGRCAGVCIAQDRCQASPPPSTVGWSCVDNTDCCDADTRCLNTRCFALRSDGSECFEDNQCRSGHCTGHGTWGTCAPSP